MTESVQPAATEAGAKPSFQQRLTQWVSIAVGLIFLLIGAMKVIDEFSLPTCASNRSEETIKSIYKSKDITLTTVSDMKTITDTKSERICTAHIESADATANIDYKIFWQGWTAQVLIATVRDETTK
jgi:hypothetical protein